MDHVQWNPPRKKQRFIAIPARNLKQSKDCTKHDGLKREFYPYFDFKGQCITSVDAQVNFDWEPEVHDPSISNAFKATGMEQELGLPPGGTKKFSLRWSGFIYVDVQGTYDIRFDAGGIERGSVMIQGMEATRGITARLEPGTPYEVRIELPQLQSKMETGKGGKKAGMVRQFLNMLARHRRRRRRLAGIPANVSLQWRIPAIAGDPSFPREVAAAKEADVVIACLGLGLGYEREGLDKKILELPTEQNELMQRVVSANPNTVAVMITGSPLSFPWIDEHAPGILLAWYPGERGGEAIASILSGDVNPSGRLPITFYKSTSQLPPFNEYDLAKGKTYWYFDGEPLYPFGFGLSYTTFVYKHVTLQKNTFRSSETIVVNVEVENAGDRPGSEVIQVYTRYIKATGANRCNERLPRQQLKGFARTSLNPGEQVNLAIKIPVGRLEFYDDTEGKFLVLKGTVEVMVGPSSRDIKRTEMIEIA